MHRRSSVVAPRHTAHDDPASIGAPSEVAYSLRAMAGVCGRDHLEHMRSVLASLVLASTLFVSPTALAADATTSFHSDEYGFTMAVPAGMELEGAKLGKWGGVHGKIDEAEVWAVGRLGEKFKPWPIQAFGIHVTKIPAKHWRVTKHAKNEGGWDWYRVAFATDGKDVVWAKYGVGPQGSFLVLLKTTVDFSLENPEALAAFGDSITLD